MKQQRSRGSNAPGTFMQYLEKWKIGGRHVLKIFQ